MAKNEGEENALDVHGTLLNRLLDDLGVKGKTPVAEGDGALALVIVIAVAGNLQHRFVRCRVRHPKVSQASAAGRKEANRQHDEDGRR